MIKMVDVKGTQLLLTNSPMAARRKITESPGATKRDGLKKTIKLFPKAFQCGE